MNDNKPCIVQRDRSILLDVHHTRFEEARGQISQYSELVKSPSSFHTYRMTPLSLWNAASAGWTSENISSSLQSLSRWEVPLSLLQEVECLVSRYGQLRLIKHPQEEGQLMLVAESAKMMEDLQQKISLKPFGLHFISGISAQLPAGCRGMLKQELTRLGYPVLDQAGYQDGQYLNVGWAGEGSSEGTASVKFQLRDYQQDAVNGFLNHGGQGGSGVLVLPCGAGKTVIGMAAIHKLQCETLILTSNTTSVRQWINELCTKTSLDAGDVGEYTGQCKEVKAVTVATYQILTHRRSKEDGPCHMGLFNERSWGLIIYDEVHLLPAPVFRATADIQATRRLGLTATLVREDGREHDVFSLIGPKCYEMPWKSLEKMGWIASVDCIEMKVWMPDAMKEKYRLAGKREQYRLASENPLKLELIKQLMQRHSDKQVLVIGQYVEQLKDISEKLDIPLIYGGMPQKQRNRLYDAFRQGEISALVVSKVANFAVDLPDASVAIEVSGSFGSRQEEAQRLGRILRPKTGGTRACFYALVTRDSREEDFALRRRLFLIEQGYEYRMHADVYGQADS
ncbi:DNA repair helicase XPB [Paenibacillus lemnae]|uniref:DNA 3'-5' helicase n=1 Tax=Paenibacillus lemnae TaxID=1330551 RepID=A0A848M327_PAELE|nr:DNA repair helicase XPB [Paenibacillus lemnae]NMO94669.1 DEAD/DEAH box helicase [Paenibacillus lemnae]